MRNKKIFIADDSAEIRDNLKKAIESLKGIQLVDQAESLKGIVNKISKTKPDIVVLDIEFKEGSSFDFVNKITELRPKPIIVILSFHTSYGLREKFFNAGADYYFNKATDFDKFLKFLKSIAT